MHFCIEGKPIAKARARAFLRGKSISLYNPQNEEQSLLRWQLILEMAEKGYLKSCDDVLHVDMCFGVPPPVSWSETRRKEAEGKPCSTRPDLDNYFKFYTDAMNGIVYKDDAAIVSGQFIKIYSEKPSVDIKITKISDEDYLKIW